MEQAYRRLISELEIHPYVRWLRYDYKCIKIRWKTGIGERLYFNRYLTKHLFKTWYKSSKYRPIKVPHVYWWDQLSNGRKIEPHYLCGVNDIEYDLHDYVSLKYWKWIDYRRANFYERLLFVQELMMFFMENKWQDFRYPDNILLDSYNEAANEDISNYKHKDNYKCVTRKEKPGIKLMQHFMPFGLYSTNSPSFYFKFKSRWYRKKLYNSIRRIILRNRILERKGRKKSFHNFSYRTVLKFMNMNKRTIKTYRFKPLGIYRRLINDYDLTSKTFFDADPGMGEKALSAFIENCPYFYVDSCPFDHYGPKMAEFLNMPINKFDESSRYDFSILDNEFLFDEKRIDDYMNKYSKHVDMSFVYVNDKNVIKITDKYPPNEMVGFYIHPYSSSRGKLLIYHH